jgi:hypothetical protein
MGLKTSLSASLPWRILSGIYARPIKAVLAGKEKSPVVFPIVFYICVILFILLLNNILVGRLDFRIIIIIQILIVGPPVVALLRDRS